MSTILIVDDAPICREPIAAMLRLKGYQTLCAGDGKEALAALANETPGLILLDVAMPRMGGIEFLQEVRRREETRDIPVILLTAVGDRETVCKAGKLGVQGYLLKSHFSLEQMMQRIGQYVAPPRSAGAEAAKPAVAAGSLKPSLACPAQPQEIPLLVGHEEMVQRIEACTEARTLAGVVAEVIALSSSPRGALADLAAILKKDPVLAARVVQVANSAAFATQKPHVASVDEAVRNIGLGTVRQIATSVGIFETFPPSAVDGFNVIRCWQHSFAVAAMMERLVPDSEVLPPGVAHLIGLCHDLGEIVLRSAFAKEFARVVDLTQRSGKPRHAVEYQALGMPHHELITLVLERLGLPASVVGAIREFHQRTVAPSGPTSLTARLLRIADYYAHGLLLASSPGSVVAPLARQECRAVLGTDQAPQIADYELRSEVLMTTALLARMGKDDAALGRPLLPQRPVEIWYARHPAFSSLDPLATALSFLGRPQVQSRLPDKSELEQCQFLVVATPKLGAAGFGINEVRALMAEAGKLLTPVLIIGPQSVEAVPPGEGNIEIASGPVTLSRIGELLEKAAGEPQGRQAA